MPSSVYLAAWLLALCLATTAAAAPPIHVNPLRRNAGPVAQAATASAPNGHGAALAERLQNVLGHRRAASGISGDATQASAIAALRRSSPQVEVRLRPGVGTPRLVRGTALQRAAAPGPGGEPDERTARAFLGAQRALLRLDDPDVELELERRDSDQLGRRHLRFAQRYRGLEVWPAGLIVHLDARGDVDAMDGAYVPTPRSIAGLPAYNATQAADFARAAVPNGGGAPIDASALIVYAPGDHPPRLAWRLSVAVAPAERWLVVLDAVSGEVLSAYNEVPSAAQEGSGIDLLGERRPLSSWSEDGQLYLVDTSKPMFDPTSDPPGPDTTRGGIVVLDAVNEPPNSNPEDIPQLFYIVSNDANTWGVPDGVSAAFNLSRVYDYYLDVHERDSLDGNGGGLLAIVRLGVGYNNAFWSGSFMAFGTGDAYVASLDVVGHELTHGVTERTANLVYRNESGAMNEAFSDVFGEAVEAYVNGTNDWLVGSQLSSELRDMSNPTRLGHPAAYGDFVVTPNDNGGVHTNSGIINHAFYQLVEGLDGAIGLEDAERIFYRALTVHLLSNSRFVDARLAAVASAREIFGATSNQARRTEEAFDAVEIFDGRGTPQPQPFPGVNGEDATLFLYYDLEEGAYFLGRREDAQQDPDEGIQLVDFPVAAARPSVVGDGSFAIFVDEENDACFVTTDGSPIGDDNPSSVACLGFPGLVSSVAVSTDGGRFGFVLLDDEGNAANEITVIELGDDGDTRTYILEAPALDGGELDTILYADTLEFAADGQFLIYDALNELELLDGSTVQAWSIFALDLISGQSQALVPPVPGLNIGYPALSQRSDGFLVFDVFDEVTSQSTITAADLTSGTQSALGIVDGGYGAPFYTGDDSAVIYSQPNDSPTEFALVRQALAGDRLTPTGDAEPWLNDGDFGVVYRRGTFVGPGSCIGDCNDNGTVSIDELIRGVSIALGALEPSVCTAFDTDASGTVSIAELIAAVNGALSGCDANG